MTQPWRVLIAAACVMASAACASGDASPTTARPASTPTADLSAGLDAVFGGVEVEAGVTYTFRFGLHCGMRYIPNLNGVNWAADELVYDGVGRVPEAYQAFLVDPDEVISGVLRTHLTLTAHGDIELTLPDGSLVSTYQPTEVEIPGCA